MSQARGWTWLAEYPTFALAYGVDDASCPSEVTVFEPDAEDVSTRWISVDAAHAIPLERVT